MFRLKFIKAKPLLNDSILIAELNKLCKIFSYGTKNSMYTHLETFNYILIQKAKKTATILVSNPFYTLIRFGSPRGYFQFRMLKEKSCLLGRWYFKWTAVHFAMDIKLLLFFICT